MSDSDQHDVRAARAHTNRLIHETSPYLLQHAHNPVDWYPWAAEAFERAKTEDKPILLSVGYSACHWCHVMEAESFENEDTARLMNGSFVNVKVDREERPDVDALYMDAVQALTGSGGWPMTVFLTPDGAPFFAGTYFPPRDRYGMPGFPRVLRSVAEWWATRREDVERQADEFRRFYRGQSERPLRLETGDEHAGGTVDLATLAAAADRLAATIDPVEGGFGSAPKFPHPLGLDFLLRMEQRRRPAIAPVDGSSAGASRLELVALTLDKMAGGGIYDQLGGGFHRYSTDARWLVPHFEKMLYDNALLAPVYLHAWLLTGDERYRRICEETLDFVLREMTDPAGGFYSTLDADSEGEEGKFYVWTADELRAALGAGDARVAGRLWGVTPRGNFDGRNILHVAASEAAIANDLGLTERDVRDVMSRAARALFDARARRVRPGLDDKVVTAWNGLMLRAMAEAGRLLDRDDYVRAAERNAAFLLEHLVRDGQLRRSWRAGQARVPAYLDDHAALVNGLLSTFEVTGETRYFAEARRWADRMLERFWSEEVSSFFDTAHDAEALIGRPRELTDNATPSGTSLAAEALLRLAALTAADRYRDTAERVLVPLAPAMAQQPSAFGHLLCALDDYVGPLYEVAIVSGSAPGDTQALLRALASRFLPRMALAWRSGGASEGDAVPLLEDRLAVGGTATAYVCEHFTCRQPVTEPSELLTQLER